MSKPIILSTKKMKHILVVEKYDKESIYHMIDAIVMMDWFGTLEFITVNKVENKIIDNINISYKAKIKKLLEKENLKKFEIKNLYGMWNVVNEKLNHKLLTLFLDVEDVEGYSYIIQLDQSFGLEQITTAEVKAIECPELWKTNNRIVGLLRRKNAVFNDRKSISTMEAYILYIVEGKKGITNKPIRGVRVLVSDEEKEEFSAKYHVGKELLDIGSLKPVVDIWSKERPWFYKVPSDAKEVKFDFSRGFMWTRFEDSGRREYEKYKI